jgi:hypothetical protein
MDRAQSVERDDHLVGAHQAEVAADQLVGYVGIGLLGVEQGRPVARRPLGPATAWPAKVPTTSIASAGSAARLIKPMLFLPPISQEESRRRHERKGKERFGG